MKAVFEFKGVKTAIEVPKYLFYLNDLTDKICTLDQDAMEETSIEEAYNYLEEELRCIFAREMGIAPDDLYCAFLNATTEEEQEFGCLIEVN